ncbi:MAG: phosphoglycerate kinase [Oligoflexales bacterium]|nr:phosphoglycerate kinase [Oligoflexales bacterium]
MELKKLEDLNLTEKSKVFVRLDLDVPLIDCQINDDSKIKAAIPTINYILGKTKKVVIGSHIGASSKEGNKDSLEMVGYRLSELLDMDVVFVEEYDKEPIEQILNQLDKNQIILLENLLNHREEVNNDFEFARCISRGIDFYVSDSFNVLNNTWASVVGIPASLSVENVGAGFLLQKELFHLERFRRGPKAPYTVVIGGHSFKEKAGLILNLINHCNEILIGGGVAYSFLAYLGHGVGEFEIERVEHDLMDAIYRNAQQRNVEIILPMDHMCIKLYNGNNYELEIFNRDIPGSHVGVDIGPKTREVFLAKLRRSNSIFFNGLLGFDENENYLKGTFDLMEAISKSKADVLLVGENKASNFQKVNRFIEPCSGRCFLSSGGSSSLEYLEGKSLPGLKQLVKG